MIATPTPAALYDVPLQLTQHLPVVTLSVNGKGPYTFAIDTGAGGQARISKSVADALHLTVIGQAQARGLGGTQRRDIVEFDANLGALRFSNVRAVVVEQTARTLPWDGILGFGLFHDYLLTLDYPGNRLQITSGSLAGEANALPLRMPFGVPQVQGRLGDVPVAFDIDSGSGGSISIDEGLAQKLRFAAAPSTVGKACGIAGCTPVKGATLNGSFTLGSVAVTNPEVTLLQLPGADTGNLGYEFLKHYRVTFDQKQLLVVIATP